MLFSCIGAEGTGKTTLLNAVEEKFGYFVTDGLSRPCINNGLRHKLTKYDFQILLNDLTLAHHEPFLKVDTHCFFTRSILDCLAYGIVDEISDNTSWVTSYLNRYDSVRDKYVYLYFPIEFEMEKDGVRTTIEHQKKVDIECLKLLKVTSTPYFTMRGSVEERLRMVEKIIKIFDKGVN